MIRIICLIICIFISCGKNFQPIEPGFVTSGHINFEGINGEKKQVKFLYSVPNGYTTKTSWPLIVTLHGYGSNATAFHELWKSVTDSLGFVLLTPQGDEIADQGFGWKWGDNAERAVLICMDLVRKSVHINPRRVYLSGFSAGGRLTYFLGLKYSNIFQGIAPLSAPFNEKLLPEKIILPSNLRVYISHGTLEKGIAKDAKIAVARLKELGLIVKHISYEGIGHNLPEPKEAELMRILKFLDSR